MGAAAGVTEAGGGGVVAAAGRIRTKELRALALIQCLERDESKAKALMCLLQTQSEAVHAQMLIQAADTLLLESTALAGTPVCDCCYAPYSFMFR